MPDWEIAGWDFVATDFLFEDESISVSVTSMLTMIAYRFALAGMMPRLTFLTSLDYFVLASTLMLFPTTRTGPGGKSYDAVLTGYTE